MHRKTILILLSTICLWACNNQQNNEENTTPGTEQIQQDITSNFVVYQPQICIDNYLSSQNQDTITVLLWSQKQQRYLDSIPNETQTDAIEWYQDNNVELVLKLKNIEPLRIQYATALLYYSILKEGEKTAIVLVPDLAQMSNTNTCFVYEIANEKWNLIKSFDILTSFVFCDENEEPELNQWLIQKNGKWFYKDYTNWITEQDTCFHPLFENRAR